jgi:hypothetical protein
VRNWMVEGRSRGTEPATRRPPEADPRSAAFRSAAAPPHADLSSAGWQSRTCYARVGVRVVNEVMVLRLLPHLSAEVWPQCALPTRQSFAARNSRNAPLRRSTAPGASNFAFCKNLFASPRPRIAKSILLLVQGGGTTCSRAGITWSRRHPPCCLAPGLPVSKTTNAQQCRRYKALDAQHGASFLS